MAAYNGRKTKQANTFELNHRVDYIYPDHTIEQDAYNDAIIDLRPMRIKQRYMPTPLAPQGSRVRYLQNKIATSPFASVTEAGEGVAEQFFAFNIPGTTEVSALHRHMTDLASCAGQTKLSILVVIKKQYVNTFLVHKARILIQRTTELFLKEGDRRQDVRLYEIPLQEWDQFTASEWHRVEAWFHNIQDLIYRRTDRAALLVDHTFQGRKGKPVHNDKWLPPRMARLTPGIARPLTAVEMVQLVNAHGFPSFKEKDEAFLYCMACKNPFRTERGLPWQLQLHCDHVACEHCMHDQPIPLTQAICPFPKCDRYIVQDPAVAARVQEGLDVNGLYVDDPRYNEWENLELSCADIDSCYDHKDTKITIHGAHLWAIWQHFREQAFNEPTFFTPSYLNFAKFPEIAIADSTFQDLVNEMEGQNITPDAFMSMWETEIAQAHKKAFMKCEELTDVHEPGVREQELQRQINLRPGYLEWLEILVFRTLMFGFVRGCQCRGKIGLHQHGKRVYLSETSR